jgi:hypothetical protein
VVVVAWAEAGATVSTVIRNSVTARNKDFQMTGLIEGIRFANAFMIAPY